MYHILLLLLSIVIPCTAAFDPVCSYTSAKNFKDIYGEKAFVTLQQLAQTPLSDIPGTLQRLTDLQPKNDPDYDKYIALKIWLLLKNELNNDKPVLSQEQWHALYDAGIFVEILKWHNRYINRHYIRCECGNNEKGTCTNTLHTQNNYVLKWCMQHYARFGEVSGSGEGNVLIKKIKNRMCVTRELPFYGYSPIFLATKYDQDGQVIEQEQLPVKLNVFMIVSSEKRKEFFRTVPIFMQTIVIAPKSASSKIEQWCKGFAVDLDDNNILYVKKIIAVDNMPAEHYILSDTRTTAQSYEIGKDICHMLIWSRMPAKLMNDAHHLSRNSAYFTLAGTYSCRDYDYLSSLVVTRESDDLFIDGVPLSSDLDYDTLVSLQHRGERLPRAFVSDRSEKHRMIALKTYYFYHREEERSKKNNPFMCTIS
jgi:hypothetical protein